MDANNDFNSVAKLFYRPIEAAIRWCNLIAFEAQILESIWDRVDLLPTTFPQWPCLYTSAEKILDAIRNNELRYGAFGKSVTSGTPIDLNILTVRHSDLKQWMAQYWPDQRPAFLFWLHFRGGKYPIRNLPGIASRQGRIANTVESVRRSAPNPYKRTHRGRFGSRKFTQPSRRPKTTH